MSDQAPVVQFPERPDRRRNATPLELDRFAGLDNTNPPDGLAFADLVEAVNCHLDDTGMLITRRDGTPVIAAVQDAYGLKGLGFYAVVGASRMLSTYRIVDHQKIRDLGVVAPPPYIWCAAGGASIFMQSPEEAWEITEAGWRPWGVPTHFGPASVQVDTGGHLRAGTYQIAMTHIEISSGREGGAAGVVSVQVPDNGVILMDAPASPHHVQVYLSAPDGPQLYRAIQVRGGDSLRIASLPGDIADGTPRLAEPLENLGMYPPPNAEAIAFWGNRVAAAVVDAPHNASAIYWSQPFQYHLFRMSEDYITVPGQVRVLADSPAGLVVGTDRAVMLVDREGNIETMMLDGCPPGNAVDWDLAGNFYLQTHRGPARVSGQGLSLLADRVDDDYTGRAALAVIEEGGFERLVVAYEDGPSETFNPLE